MSLSKQSGADLILTWLGNGVCLIRLNGNKGRKIEDDVGLPRREGKKRNGKIRENGQINLPRPVLEFDCRGTRREGKFRQTFRSNETVFMIKSRIS